MADGNSEAGRQVHEPEVTDGERRTPHRRDPRPFALSSGPRKVHDNDRRRGEHRSTPHKDHSYDHRVSPGLQLGEGTRLLDGGVPVH